MRFVSIWPTLIKAWIALAIGVLLSFDATQAQTFVDASATAGIVVTHAGHGEFDERIGSGAAWFDYDNDGDLDLYMTQRVGANLLFENQLAETGTATFLEVAASRGAEDAAHDGTGVAAADFDNDGDLDLIVANSDEDVLLRNELIETGSPNFTDITAGSGLDASGISRSQSGSWGDFDEDGILDLYVAVHQAVEGTTASQQDQLYHGRGDGTFDVITSLLIGDSDLGDGFIGDGNDDLEGKGFITAWTDFDHDGDIDLFLQNDCPFGIEALKLWRNDDGVDPLTWAFTEVSHTLGLPDEIGGLCVNSMGIAVGDYNRDGRWDYFYTDVQSASLIRNEGGGTFTDVTQAAGVFEDHVPGTDPPQNRLTWGTVFTDYDNDGWQDLAVAAGTLQRRVDDNPQPNLFYRNNGDGTFDNISTTVWPEDTRRGRTIVMGDYDADGDPDLFLVNYESEAVLLENTGGPDHDWLQVLLVGTESNRNGIGATVRATDANGITQHYEVRSGSSVGGGDDLAAYFGFGDLGASTLVDLDIIWPSGIIQTVPDVAVNQRLTIEEAGVRVTAMPNALPLEIGADGGSFNYDLMLGNHTTSATTRNLWIELVGTGISIIRGPISRTLSAGEVLSATVRQNVPASAPAGTYSITAHQGTFPLAESSDRFLFTKAAAKDGTASAANPGHWATDFEAVFSGGAVEVTALPETYALSAVYPNPFNPQAHFSLAVQQAQPVAIGLYDVLGREVARLFDGPMAAHETHTFTVDGAGLPSGVYLLQVRGVHFSASQTVTLLK